jgi:hypothetical protein
MPRLGDFLGWQDQSTFNDWYRQFERGSTVGYMIGHRGITIVLVRGTTPRAEQRVLLVPAGRDTTADSSERSSGSAASEQLLLIGPPTLDIQRGDKFKHPSTIGRLNYEVKRVERAVHGMIQAYAQETQ